MIVLGDGGQLLVLDEGLWKCLRWDLQEDQAELLRTAGLDPEALAALPPEMRQEVLEQVREGEDHYHSIIVVNGRRCFR